MNSPDPVLPAQEPASLTEQSYAQLVDTLSSAVFIGFIERGRLSLSSSANSILAAGYDLLQRVQPAPWPKDPDTLALLKRDIQIALLDGLIREGMPGVRTAVMASYERMVQAANSLPAAEPQSSPATEPIAVSLTTVTDLPAPVVAESPLPEPTPEASSETEQPDALPTREEILLRIRKAVAQQLNKDIDTITIDTNFVEDLGADSLDLVELVMLLEACLKIELADNDVQKLGTMRQALDLACTLLKISPANMEDSQTANLGTDQ